MNGFAAAARKTCFFSQIWEEEKKARKRVKAKQREIALTGKQVFPKH